MPVDPAAPASTGNPGNPDAPAGKPAAPPRDHAHEGGHRDTIESILIAFILAFIFRAFVVEAFVIPTGSMAPTLLGAHARLTCDECGYQFQVNFSSGSGDDQNTPAEVSHSAFPDSDCPNCGHRVHDADEVGPTVPIHYGDRILVLKYAYLFQQPQRWDVVVFKSPDDPDPYDKDYDPDPPNDAGKTWYTINFIKRLVGRPNETLMVLDGDVYVSTTGGTSPADFKVQRKPRHVQDALWRIVCDGDFVPRRDAFQPWVVERGAGWDIGAPDHPKRVYTFDANQSGASGTIRFDPAFNRGRAMTDFLAYAQVQSGHHNVSDVKLSLLYDRQAGDGPLRMRLTKLDDTFTAELTPRGAKLFRKRGVPSADDNDLGEQIAAADNVGALGGGPIQLDFINVDYGVTLRVGDVDLLHADYDPDVDALLNTDERGVRSPKAEVRITAAAQRCALSHVSLWRDVYYTNGPAGPNQIRWARPEEPIHLGPDEYFVLGDNTVISKDARYWDKPINLPDEDLEVAAGRVPGRFMLGKAFFVYWPAGYRPLGSKHLPGLIPNFGDMRLIH